MSSQDPESTEVPEGIGQQFISAFDNKNPQELRKMAHDFLHILQLNSQTTRDVFERGAALAHADFDTNVEKQSISEDELSTYAQGEDIKWLYSEISSEYRKKFKMPWRLFLLVFLCSMGAAVQGWDESAINGAVIYFPSAFSLDSKNQPWLIGLISGTPYLCCTFSCVLTPILNKYLARRGTIFFCCLVSASTCLAQAFVKNWQSLLIARFFLGFGIGPKSATIPIYASECAPAPIRGALVMMWQVFTAFGIMAGYVIGASFRGVLSAQGDTCDPINADTKTLLSTQCSLHWRLMLGSPMVLPMIVAATIYTLPESPRWLVGKSLHIKNIQDDDDEDDGRKAHLISHELQKAWNGLVSLRNTKIQAARDLLRIYYQLDQEKKRSETLPNKPLLCGVNIMVYWSTSVLTNIVMLSELNALLFSMGFGIINFFFAWPAFFLIDTYGRRALLLFTFPLMMVFQFWIGLSYYGSSSIQKIMIPLGMYLFSVVYSPGEGPVPFVYASESMPLYIRDFGMGVVTSINWLLNFLLALTWPFFVEKIQPVGAFCLYAGFCFIGFLAILFCVPETKGKTLEELDKVFNKTSWVIAKEGSSWFWEINRNKTGSQVNHNGDGNWGSPIFGGEELELPDYEQMSIQE